MWHPTGMMLFFNVGRGYNAGRAASGSVKPGLTIAGYPPRCLCPTWQFSHFFHTYFQANSSSVSKLSLKFPGYCSSPLIPWVGSWWSPSSLTWSINTGKCPPDSFVYSIHTHTHFRVNRCCYSGDLTGVGCVSTCTVIFKTVVYINLFLGYFLLFNAVYSSVWYLCGCLKLCTHLFFI